MKTVQQIIKSIDRRTLLQAYLAIDKPKINVMETETMDEKMYREIKDDYKDAWNRFVESIITLMVKSNEFGKRGIILGFQDVHHSVSHDLFLEDEVLKYGVEADAYGYSLEEWETIPGYCVAPTRYTKKHIYEIMAQVLYNVSFWGYTKERVDEERAATQESIAEGECDEKETSRTLCVDDETNRRMCDSLGGEISPKECQTVKQKFWEAEYAYSQYLRGQEIRELIKKLKETKC